jgi:hypothetical protein
VNRRCGERDRDLPNWAVTVAKQQQGPIDGKLTGSKRESQY